MNLIVVSFALSAGAASAFNPCGVALLPSYLAYLFLRAGQMGDDPWRRLLQGAAAGGAMTLGFLLVFGVTGLLVSIAVQTVRDVLPWITVSVGVALVALGLWTLTGRGSRYLRLAWTPTLRPDRVRPGYGSFVVYGLAYATASLSCTLPVFLVVVAQAFAGGMLQGLAGFAAYAVGMGLVVSALSMGVAVARDTTERWLHAFLPHVERASALLIMAAGAYLVYYWVWGPGVGVR